jgi:hypothetical protein
LHRLQGAYDSPHVNLDVGSRHPDRIVRDVVVRRRAKDFSRPDVELRAMQRASHLVPANFPFGQGGFFMRTHVVEREEFAIDVEESNLLSLYIDKPTLAGSDFVRPCDFHKVRLGTPLGRPRAFCVPWL